MNALLPPQVKSRTARKTLVAPASGGPAGLQPAKKPRPVKETQSRLTYVAISQNADPQHSWPSGGVHGGGWPEEKETGMLRLLPGGVLCRCSHICALLIAVERVYKR